MRGIRQNTQAQGTRSRHFILSTAFANTTPWHRELYATWIKAFKQRFIGIWGLIFVCYPSGSVQ